MVCEQENAGNKFNGLEQTSTVFNAGRTRLERRSIRGGWSIREREAFAGSGSRGLSSFSDICREVSRCRIYTIVSQRGYRSTHPPKIASQEKKKLSAESSLLERCCERAPRELFGPRALITDGIVQYNPEVTQAHSSLENCITRKSLSVNYQYPHTVALPSMVDAPTRAVRSWRAQWMLKTKRFCVGTRSGHALWLEQEILFQIMRTHSP